MLETLGVDPLAEQVYRSMLDHPQDGPSELAVRSGTGVSEVLRAFDHLSELSLIRPSQGNDSGFDPVAPELAMASLLARQQARLTEEQSRIETSRAAAAQLIAQYSTLRPGTPSDHLVGVDAIRERLTRLGETAESEVLTFAPGGGHPAADLEASRGPNGALLERGISMRTIYLHSVRNHQPTVDHVSWLRDRGAEVRTIASLPTRMILVDRKLALLPTRLSDAREGATLVRSEGAIAGLHALFELTWASASVFGTKAASDPHGLQPQEAAVLRMLAEGHTDVTIAKKLGVSHRTARRVAADLLDRLSARSRFEAGVHAVQDGWLPATR